MGGLSFLAETWPKNRELCRFICRGMILGDQAAAGSGVPDPNQNPFIRMFNQSDKVLSARSEKVDENGVLSQVILVGDSDFMADQGGGRSPENHIFIMNSVDYLIGDRDLIALRSREITSRPLEDVSDEAKRTWKWINIFMPSFLIVGFGLIRMRSQKRRSSVLEELYG